MTKQEKENWKKRKDFEDESIDVKPWAGLNVEHQNTIRHEFVKFCLTRAIYETGRAWDSEVEFPNGREADVLDLGPDDGKPVVYEVETGVTPKRKTEKLNHFYYGFEDVVRDVIVIDPAEVPRGSEEAVEYLATEVVLG